MMHSTASSFFGSDDEDERELGFGVADPVAAAVSRPQHAIAAADRSLEPQAGPSSRPWSTADETYNARRPSALTATRHPSGQSAADRKAEPSRADQIIQHFFAKVTAVVTQSRLTHLDDLAGSPAPSSPAQAGRKVSRRGSATNITKKPNKWFNLELPEPDLFKAELKLWKSVSSLQSIPPLYLSIYLDTLGLNSSQALVLSDQRGRRSRVHSNQRKRVILERWTLRLQPPYSYNDPPELPTAYRLAILFFRTLYTLVRTMPAWSLQRRLMRRASPLSIGASLSSAPAPNVDDSNEIDVDVKIAEDEDVTAETMTFPTILTPNGTLALQCSYRLNTDFSVEDVEALLSSRFINEDYFSPTIGRLQREEEAAVRPGSLPSASRGARLQSASSSPSGRPSYGSLGSRHQVPLPTPSGQAEAPNPAAIALPAGASPDSVSSSGRFGSYGASGSGGPIEPAFVSLSRARHASYTGSIQRTMPSPTAAPAYAGQALTGSGSSGSPVFRAAGSQHVVPTSSSSPVSYSPQLGGAGPLSNVYRVPSSGSPRFPSSGSPSPLPYIARSPLATGTSTPSATITGARPIPTPSQSTSGNPRTYSTGGGSYSRSYGRGSSGGSMSGGEYAGTVWSGPESLGRRASGRFSFESRYSTSGGAGSSTAIGRVERAPEEKRFIVSPTVDEDDIKDFVGMIDSRPDFGRSLGASMFASRSQADEALRKLKGSVLDSTSSLEAALGPARLSGLRRQASRLSIEEEPSDQFQAQAQPVPSNPTPRVRRHSLLAQQSSPPSEASAPSTARYFSASSSPRSDASLPQYIPRAHRRSNVGIGGPAMVSGFDVPSRGDSPALEGSERGRQRDDMAVPSSQTHSSLASFEDGRHSSDSREGTAGASPLDTGSQHEEGGATSSSYADDGGDELAVVGRLELSGPETGEEDAANGAADQRGRLPTSAATGVVWHTGAVGAAIMDRYSSSSRGPASSHRDRTPRRDYFSDSPDLSWME